MKIFLAGGVHSNIGPAYKRMVADNDISGDGFARALANENFWRGGGAKALDKRTARRFAHERKVTGNPL